MNTHTISKTGIISLVIAASFLVGVFQVSATTNPEDELLTQTSMDLIKIAPELREGNVVGSTDLNDPDLYIVNQHGMKRLFLNPKIFNLYGHLSFKNVKRVEPTVLDALPTSGLFSNCEGTSRKVYALDVQGEDDAVLNEVALTDTQLLDSDPDFYKKVFCINNREQALYRAQVRAYTSTDEIPTYVRILPVPSRPIVIEEPIISDVIPQSASIGEIVRIYGENMLVYRANGESFPVTVRLDGRKVTIARPVSTFRGDHEVTSSNVLAFKLPGYLTYEEEGTLRRTALQSGTYKLTVEVLGQKSNAVKFVIGGGNQAPVIHGISAPTTLKVGQTGTWTLNVSDPDNDDLRYKAVWGDNLVRPLSAISDEYYFRQTATFTHVYSEAGIYNPVFYVSDSAGNTVRTSATVKVGDISIHPQLFSINPAIGTVGTTIEMRVSGDVGSRNSVYMNGKLAATNVPVISGVNAAVAVRDFGIALNIMQFTIPEGLGGGVLCSGDACTAPVRRVVPGTYLLTFKNENGKESNGLKLSVYETETVDGQGSGGSSTSTY